MFKNAKRPAYDAGVYPAVHAKKYADRYDSREAAERVANRWERSWLQPRTTIEEVAE
jgi:hypothetical protein